MPKIAKLAPVILAKTSKKSAVLVVVTNSCNISIVIPKKTDNINEMKKGLNLFWL